MPYYQNVFESDFIGALLLSDRQFNMSFKVRANRNTSTLMRAFGTAPYNTVGNTSLTFNYSINSGAIWGAFAVTLTSGAAVSASTIVDDLNADTTFASWFTASLDAFALDQKGLITIRSIPRRENFKAYISNSSAETILKFNRYAGIAQLPSYFDRHLISNGTTYADSVGMLVKLVQPTHDTLITEAGLSTTAKADYELLAGRSGMFTFYKQTVDASSRITTKIEYPAGAVAGDLAKKTTYSYTGAQTAADVICEVIYTLTGSDLVTPP